MKTTKSLRLFKSLALALLFTTTVTIKAQTIDTSENSALFGNLSQSNSNVTVNAATACVPTSVTNGLTFLNNVNGDTVFTNNPATYANLNSLATSMGTTGGASGGTSYGSGVTGMTSYMAPNGTNPALVGVSISGQYAYNSWGAGLPANSPPSLQFNMTTPTASFMGNALQANSAVQLAIWWGTYNFTNNTFTPTPGNGTHEIDLYSLDLTNGNGTGDIIVPESDPSTSGTTSATAQNLAATIQTVAFNSSNYLYLTYGASNDTISGTPGETDPSNGQSTPLDSVAVPANAPAGIIVADYVESIPEPSTWVLLFGGLGLLAFWRLRSRRA